MRQEVGTVACVVNDRRVFVSVQRGAISELDGKFISRHVMLKLGDEELPVVFRRCELWPQNKGGEIVWSMLMEFESEDKDPAFLDGTHPVIVLDCREEFSEDEDYIRVRR